MDIFYLLNCSWDNRYDWVEKRESRLSAFVSAGAAGADLCGTFGQYFP